MMKKRQKRTNSRQSTVGKEETPVKEEVRV
jgi:hypothetical protein